jgi:predicted nucleic acid-binding protein
VKVFIDTWGWLALQDKREPRHQEVKNFYKEFRQRKGTVYTTDYVLDETITLLFRRLPFSTAKEFLKDIDQAVEEGYLHLERVTPERFNMAKDLRIKFRDKPRISFTDFTSMIIMSECIIAEILTEDDHFAQVGMGFGKVP